MNIDDTPSRLVYKDRDCLTPSVEELRLSANLVATYPPTLSNMAETSKLQRRYEYLIM